MYRIASASQVALWNVRLAEAFPSFAARVTCFGYDWLGRAFALDCKRMEGGHPGVVLLEPGTGEVLEIPGDLVAFHNRELIENREAALAESFFRSWLEAGGRAPDHGQCVGYKVPLFLGGKDVLENLELSDIDVYWSLTAQLLMAAKRVGTGARLGKASIDD